MKASDAKLPQSQRLFSSFPWSCTIRARKQIIMYEYKLVTTEEWIIIAPSFQLTVNFLTCCGEDEDAMLPDETMQLG